MAIVAVIFDFDDTLVPDSTSALLSAHGIDPSQFWTVEVRALIEQGYDPPLAYLRLLLDEVAPGRRLEGLSNEALREFGRSLDESFFVGIPQVFDDLRGIAADYRDVQVEFFIVSGGLEEVILGSQIVGEHFRAVYGCQLGEDEASGAVRYVKRCITFTEKTRYLFEINKGIDPRESKTQPHLVNRDVPGDQRPIPFPHMIYVGDGLTDIPCFSLVKNMGGRAFGVFDPGKETSAKQALQTFLETDRVLSMNAPRFRDDDELGALLRSAVGTVASNIVLDRQAT